MKIPKPPSSRVLHARWLASLTVVLADLDAVPSDELGYRWRLATRYGPLLLTVHEPRKFRGRYLPNFSLFGRFMGDGPYPAAANCYSGKWNHHHTTPKTEEEAEASVTHLFRRLTAVKLQPVNP